MPKRKPKKITIKQQRFIDSFDGDIKKASEIAGFSYNYGRQLMTMKKHKHIQEAIRKRELTKSNVLIANREERQIFWTQAMRGKEDGIDRLKASELLGRSEGDFLERVKDETPERKVRIDGPLGDLLGKVYVTHET